MKKVKINFMINNHPTTAYSYGGVRFSWLTPPKKNTFSQITNWHSCRETFVGEFNKLYNKNRKWPYKYELSITHMRFMVMHKYRSHMAVKSFESKCSDNFKWIKHAKRILNILEKYLGWRLTTVYKCSNDELIRHKIDIFVISGSAKWLRSPQLLSLYLLILRLSKDKNFQTQKNIEDIKKLNICLKDDDSRDTLFWKTLRPYLFGILDNVNDLFFYQSTENSHKNHNGTHGIDKLIKGSSNKITGEIFCKIKNNIDNKKNKEKCKNVH